MSRLATLAVALLAVTVGCGGLADGGPESPAADRTVTPAPVPAERVTDSTGDVPAPEALATSHATVLSETNYTVLIHERVVAGNRTIRQDRRRREVGQNAARYRLRRELLTDGLPSDAVAPVVSHWYNGSTVVSRVGVNDSSVRYFSNATDPLSAPSNHDYIERLARAFALSRTQGDDGVVFSSSRFVAPEFAPSPPSLGRPQNASVTLHVTTRGHVSSYRYTFESTAPSVAQTVRVVREVRFEKIGQTQVQPPRWATRGKNGTIRRATGRANPQTLPAGSRAFGQLVNRDEGDASSPYVINSENPPRCTCPSEPRSEQDAESSHRRNEGWRFRQATPRNRFHR